MHTSRSLSALLALAVCVPAFAHEDEFVEATYPIKQIRCEDLNGTDIAEFVRTWVGQDNWDKPATIEVAAGGLKVRQRVDHHATIKLALDELSRAFTQGPRSLAEWRKVHASEVAAQRTGADAKDKAVYEALRKPTTLMLKGATWAHALKVLSAQSGVTLALHPEAAVDAGAVDLNVKEVSVEAALDALLANDAPEGGLSWVVREGKVTIGDDDCLQLPMVSRIYDASAFKGGTSLGAVELIDVLNLCLPWQSGSVSVAYGRLILQRSHDVHAKAIDLLEDAAQQPAKYRKLLKEQIRFGGR